MDYKAELDRYVADSTCQWCGRVRRDLKVVPFTLATRTVKHAGYTLKHRRLWRVCVYCLGMSYFDRWIFPVIAAGVPEHESLTAIMLAQPMMTLEEFPLEAVFTGRMMAGKTAFGWCASIQDIPKSSPKWVRTD